MSMRYATLTLRGSDTVDTVKRYLPSNYEVVEVDGDQVTIRGRDAAGWTLDGYVIPRLASGLIWAKEVEGGTDVVRE